MIKINLARRRMATTVAVGGSSPGLSLLSRFHLEQFKDVPLRRVAIPMISAVVLNFCVGMYEDYAIEEQDHLIAHAEQEKGQAVAELARYANVEAARKSVEADEIILRAKLATVRKLIEGRDLPPKVLLSVSKAIPSEVWLTQLVSDSQNIKFKGVSLDFSLISDFMKELGNTAYMTDVQLVSAGKDSESAVKDAVEFELTAKKRDP